MEELRVATTMLKYIEKGEIEKAKYLYSPEAYNSVTDKKELLAFIHEIHPFDPKRLPVFISNKDLNKIWYERSYYSISEGEFEYYIQVYLELTVTEEKILVSDIQILTGDQIQERPDIETWLTSIDNNTPPPPPAPKPM